MTQRFQSIMRGQGWRKPSLGESSSQDPVGQASGQQTDSLGRVTGGVAHEFNNLLTVVLGNATALRVGAQARADVQAVRRAELIERAAERGSRLASQLLAFSGRQILTPRIISAYDVVSGSHHLLSGAAGEAIQIVLVAERRLWRCRADPAQLESAVLNLVLNARDALPDGGKVTIRFSNRHVSEVDCDLRRVPGEYVCIDVQDTGVGIRPELLDRVFEPFFTTKPIGTASGLGLAQVHGFARQSGGWAELASVVGQGTTVSMFLPRSRGSDERSAPGAENALSQPTILMVEPDLDQGTANRTALNLAGYYVLQASVASGAITHLVSDAPIDVLLTAERLAGGLSGGDLGRHAQMLRPQLRVLVCSTKPEDAPRESGSRPAPSRGAFAFLMQPYAPEDLIPVIAELLASDRFSTEAEELVAEARDFATLDFDITPTPDPPASKLDSALSGVRKSTVRLGVLPFRTEADDNKAFCAGLAEEITGAIAAFRTITCVAPASLAAVARAGGGHAECSRQLDLDFVVDGSLRRKDDEIRVSVRLVRTSALGEVMWSRRFGGKLSNVLNIQDGIAREIASQVGTQVLDWETRDVAMHPQVNATARDLMLRAIPAIHDLDRAGFFEAGSLLEQSLKLDPDCAACYSWLAHWYLLKFGQGWEDDPIGAIGRADALSQRAIALDPSDARGLTVAGHVRAFLHRDATGALALHERALALNPSLALAWCYAGLAQSYCGRHEEAIRSIQRAQHLSPHHPHAFFFEMALIMPFLMIGDYTTAAKLGRKARNAHPGMSSTYKGLVAALGLLGANAEAATAREALLRLEPRFCVTSALARSPLLRHEDRDRYSRGLRLAGIPERPTRQPLATV